MENKRRPFNFVLAKADPEFAVNYKSLLLNQIRSRHFLQYLKESGFKLFRELFYIMAHDSIWPDLLKCWHKGTLDVDKVNKLLFPPKLGENFDTIYMGVTIDKLLSKMEGAPEISNSEASYTVWMNENLPALGCVDSDRGFLNHVLSMVPYLKLVVHNIDPSHYMNVNYPDELAVKTTLSEILTFSRHRRHYDNSFTSDLPKFKPNASKGVLETGRKVFFRLHFQWVSVSRAPFPLSVTLHSKMLMDVSSDGKLTALFSETLSKNDKTMLTQYYSDTSISSFYYSAYGLTKFEESDPISLSFISKIDHIQFSWKNDLGGQVMTQKILPFSESEYQDFVYGLEKVKSEWSSSKSNELVDFSFDSQSLLSRVVPEQQSRQTNSTPNKKETDLVHKAGQPVKEDQVKNFIEFDEDDSEGIGELIQQVQLPPDETSPSKNSESSDESTKDESILSENEDEKEGEDKQESNPDETPKQVQEPTVVEEEIESPATKAQEDNKELRKKFVSIGTETSPLFPEVQDYLSYFESEDCFPTNRPKKERVLLKQIMTVLEKNLAPFATHYSTKVLFHMVESDPDYRSLKHPEEFGKWLNMKCIEHSLVRLKKENNESNELLDWMKMSSEKLTVISNNIDKQQKVMNALENLPFVVETINTLSAEMSALNLAITSKGSNLFQPTNPVSTTLAAKARLNQALIASQQFPVNNQPTASVVSDTRSLEEIIESMQEENRKMGL